ncbi:MAG: hypothetical protein ACUZ8N_05290 [Candidatus Scalindua sp.]
MCINKICIYYLKYSTFNSFDYKDLLHKDEFHTKLPGQKAPRTCAKNAPRTKGAEDKEKNKNMDKKN